MVLLGLWVLPGAALAQWIEPVPVTEVNTEYTEWTPFLSFDGLTLYFARHNTDTFYYTRIYQATREVPECPFTLVEEISELNYSAGHVSSPWVSPDNLRMYYYRTEPGSYKRLKVSERASVDEPWPQGTNISELNALGNVKLPRLTADELTIVFQSEDIPGGQGERDIWMASRADLDLPFGEVRNLTEINTAAAEGSAFISPDGLTLYFSSARNGLSQLFKSTRESLENPFGNIEHLSVFDTPGGNSTLPCVSSDGMAFYFSRNLIGGPADIYVSYIPEPATVLLLGLGAVLLRKKRR
jgi:Tol biopolymer transport system component